MTFSGVIMTVAYEVADNVCPRQSRRRPPEVLETRPEKSNPVVAGCERVLLGRWFEIDASRAVFELTAFDDRSARM